MIEFPEELSGFGSYKTTLEWHEISVAVHIANLRQTLSLKDKRRDKFGPKINIDQDMRDNIYGVLGEMALAKMKNIYFDVSVDTFKAPDLGKTIQIKTVGANTNKDLVVRPANDDKLFFALVEVKKTLNWNYEAIYHGGIWGYEAKKHDEWKTDYGYPNRPICWQVPVEFLTREPLSQISEEQIIRLNELLADYDPLMVKRSLVAFDKNVECVQDLSFKQAEEIIGKMLKQPAVVSTVGQPAQLRLEYT